jgi:biotin carboxyl carrier protein
MKVTRISPGVYRVDDGRQRWTVAIAGPAANRWVWVDGQVARLEAPTADRGRGRSSGHDLSAPMPSTVVKLLVGIGAGVKRGDTLVMLEAMKMELPIRAPRDGIVTAIHCRTGELVQPGHQLLTIENSEQP